MRYSEVLLGLGANLGDPVAQLGRAVGELGRLISLEAVSAVYRTEPVGFLDQPDFFNLVCRGRTDLGPRDLLRAARRVEAELGRERTFANAPRTIDIDLLAHGAAVVDDAELTLPHPRMHLRAFVLVPLQEVAPEWRHPLLDRSAAELLRELEPGGRVRRWGALPGDA